MKELDVSRLKSLLNVDFEEDIIDDKDYSKDIKSNNCILVYLSVNLLDNFYLTDSIAINKYASKYEPIRHSFKLKYFDRIFNALNRVKDVTDSDKKFIGGIKNLNKMFDEVISFYEELEDYHKCAKLLDIKNMLC